MAAIGKDLDANIAILDAITPTGAIWTDKEIAEICDSSQQAINYTWLTAKKKLSQNPFFKQLFEDMK
jgi:hypothetical protein